MRALPDVEETASDLIWMDERYLIEAFGLEPQVEPDVAVDVLHDIWVRTLYDHWRKCRPRASPRCR